MDQGNLRRLRELRPKDFNGQLGSCWTSRLTWAFATCRIPTTVASDAFERMLDLVELATKALLARVIEAPPVE